MRLPCYCVLRVNVSGGFNTCCMSTITCARYNTTDTFYSLLREVIYCISVSQVYCDNYEKVCSQTSVFICAQADKGKRTTGIHVCTMYIQISDCGHCMCVITIAKCACCSIIICTLCVCVCCVCACTRVCVCVCSSHTCMFIDVAPLPDFQGCNVHVSLNECDSQQSYMSIGNLLWLSECYTFL